jgi:hypothetical protein
MAYLISLALRLTSAIWIDLYDYGSHTIVLGLVRATACDPVNPPLYQNGKYAFAVKRRSILPFDWVRFCLADLCYGPHATASELSFIEIAGRRNGTSEG